MHAGIMLYNSNKGLARFLFLLTVFTCQGPFLRGGEGLKSDLNAKQELFVKYYLMSFNATQAAIEAGYSKKTADVQGAKLLRNVKVEKIIKGEMERLRERLADDANRVYAGLWQEVNELTDKINTHYKAEKEMKRLIKKEHTICFAAKLDSPGSARHMQGPIDYVEQVQADLREVGFEIRETSLDMLRPAQFMKAQELRARLLHDLFDRAGYKPTDKLHMSADISGGINLGYMTDEELLREAEKLGS